MPQLAATRFACIGHTKARIRDVILEYTGKEGSPEASILRLRNGGGKSTLVAYTFSVILPDKRDFLSSKEEGGMPRELEDYVQPNDKSVVAHLWQLDAGAPNEPPQHFITGAFYEWRGASADANRFRRVWFCAKVNPKEHRLTLQGLPLYVNGPHGEARRNATSFKEEWSTLREKYPECEVKHTENQREWREYLEQAGIDPELYYYQVKMNHREGGADALFRFNNGGEFVDFLLELVMKPTMGEIVSENIGKHRRDLKERRHELIPEKALVLGVEERLRPLVAVAEERRTMLQEGTRLAGETSALRHHAQARAVELGREADQAGEDAKAAIGTRMAHEASALMQRRRAASLARHAARTRLSNAEGDFRESERILKETMRDAALWEAAIPLAQALRHEAEAASILQELQGKKTDAADLLARLTRAADEYHSALTHRTAHLTSAHSRELAAARAHRKAKQDHNGRIATNRGAHATAAATAKLMRGNLTGLDQARARLASQGILQPQERGDVAAARWLAQASHHATLAKRHETEIGQYAEKLGPLDAAIVNTAGEIARLQASEKGAAELLATAHQDRGRLQKLAALRRIFEAPDLDIERLPEDAPARLADALRMATDELIRLRLEGAGDERALDHLKTHGLLPPTPDAQRVIRALEPHLPWVRSGWLALESVLPQDAARRRALVQQAPHIVLGVIVRDADYEKAKQILAEARVTPELPITLAPQSALLAQIANGFSVVGPRSDAYHDPSAARTELERLTLSQDAHARKVRAAADLRNEIEAAKTAFESFRATHPKGWFDQQEALLRSVRASNEKAQADKARLEAEKKDLAKATETATRAMRAEEQNVNAARTKAQDAQRFHETHEAPADEWNAELARSMEEMARLDVEHATLLAHVESSEAAAREHDGNAQRVHAELVERQTDLTRLAYVPGTPMDPAEGPLDTRRFAYDSAKSAYEDAVDEPGLRRMHEKALTDAGKARSDLAKKLRDEKLRDLNETHVHAKLQELPPNKDVAEQWKESVSKVASDKGRHGTNVQARERAEVALSQANQEAEKLGEVPEIPPHEAPAGETTAEALAADALKEAARLDALALTSQQDAARLDAAAAAKRAHAELRSREADTLSQLQTSYDDILVPPVTSIEWPAPASDDAIKSRVDAIAARLATLQKDKRNLDARRSRAVREVKTFSKKGDFEKLRTKLAPQLDRYEDQEMEERAEKLAEELRLRAQTIDAALADMEKHRELLINELLHAAEEGVSVLRTASTQSRLPDHVQGFGGSQFLRITTSDPEGTQARRDRVGQLIDAIVDEDEVPNGMTLIKRAVRQLASPVRVNVLFPDSDHGKEWVPIEEITKTSGGEKITSAVLLYCTLAQLRAKQNGRRRPRTTLLLDNPFGTASRRKFVELQLAVARAMNVQLIYTTGILDDEAISPFPRLIQLKNEKVDRNTNQRYIELQDALGHIDAAHLGRELTVTTATSEDPDA